MKELLQTIVEALVTKPEAIEISETPGETMTLFELRVAKEDFGRVIDRQGTTVKSIRDGMACLYEQVKWKARGRITTHEIRTADHHPLENREDRFLDVVEIC